MESPALLPVRAVWPDEARDFTPWLRDCPSALGDLLGFGLAIEATEVRVGPFRLDMIGRDAGTGRRVVIENQFGSSDHDHLGKLITYSANKDAETMVWVAERFRAEHLEAVAVLNRDTPEQKQVFCVEVFATGSPDQPHAHFRVVAAPSSWVATAAALEVEAFSEEFRRLRPGRTADGLVAARRPASDLTAICNELWKATFEKVEAKGLGWQVGWRLQRPTVVKMKAPYPESNFQFTWYQGTLLQVEFGIYPRVQEDRATRAYAMAIAGRATLEEAFDGPVLIKAPGENGNKGMGIYTVRAAEPGDDLDELSEWVIDQGVRLRRAVARLDLS